MATSTDTDTSIRGGFVRVEPTTGIIVQILAFQLNPATLSRALVVSALNEESTAEPRELITFALGLEATGPNASQLGIYPLLSALELVMYVPAGPPPLILFVWGSRRVLPVRLIELQVKEQLFDATLTPTQAELAVTLQVLKKADLATGSKGRDLWDAHLLIMQDLANAVPLVALADLGLGGEGGLVPP